MPVQRSFFGNVSKSLPEFPQNRIVKASHAACLIDVRKFVDRSPHVSVEAVFLPKNKAILSHFALLKFFLHIFRKTT